MMKTKMEEIKKKKETKEVKNKNKDNYKDGQEIWINKDSSRKTGKMNKEVKQGCKCFSKEDNHSKRKANKK